MGIATAAHDPQRPVDPAAEIERESIRVRCRQSVHSLPNMIFMLLVVGALLWDEVAAVRLAGWLGLSLVATLVRTAACLWVQPRAETADRRQLALLERVLIATVLANTLAMGAGMWWAAAVGSLEVQFFVTLSLCFYSVAALINASSHASSFAVGVIANLGQGVAFWLAQGDDGIRIAVPLVVTAYMLITFGRANARAFAEAVRMKFQNIDLVAQLSDEKHTVEHALSIAHEANQAKARFLAQASHDLRQPLHALMLQVGSIRSQVAALPVRKSVDQALEVVQSVDTLFRNLLDLSRMEAGALKPRLQVLPVAELFARIEGEFRMLAHAKSLAFDSRAPDALVQTDAVLVERVLRNLLANAVRYTEAGSVTLSAQEKDGGIVVSVTDTGPGIGMEHRARIFEEYTQIDPAGKGGVGLGLAIVRRIDSLLGLRLALESEPGKGSRFSFELARPARLEQPAKQGQAGADQQHVHDESELPSAHAPE